MLFTEVLVLRGTRGRCLWVVEDLFLRPLVGLEVSLVVKGPVGVSLHLEEFKLQGRVLHSQLVEFLSDLMERAVPVLPLPLQHQLDVESVEESVTLLWSVVTQR